MHFAVQSYSREQHRNSDIITAESGLRGRDKVTFEKIMTKELLRDLSRSISPFSSVLAGQGMPIAILVWAPMYLYLPKAQLLFHF